MNQMTKIWEWIKDIVYKIADLISRQLKREAPIEPEPTPLPIPLEKKLSKAIQKRQAREGRVVDIRRGGSNMPKCQPCPTCYRRAKRKRKTMGGAYYKCSIHGEFFMRASL